MAKIKWDNGEIPLQTQYISGGRIPEIREKRVRLLRKLMAIRFYLGFSRLSDSRALIDGRMAYLGSDFASRQEHENTRDPLNGSIPRVSVDTYSFVVITDPHLTTSDTRKLEHLSSSLIPSDAFLVVNGDITASGSRAQLDTFLSLIHNFPIPCYPVIGNHDIYFHSWPIWKELMGTTIYRVDFGDTTLIMLDSANGRFGPAQLEWLEQQLADIRKHTFVFSHCNFFISSLATIQQFAALMERAKIVSLLDGKADAVFTGHSHQRYVHIAGGVPYINTDDFRDNASFCRVYVSGDDVRYEYGNVETPESAKETAAN